MKVYSRADWHARPSSHDVAHQDPAKIVEVFVHHSDSPGKGVYTFAGAAKIVRDIQAFHMGTRGWSDIAYHYLVVPNANRSGRAWIFAGRPLDVVPAAQQGHNTGTATICVVQKDPEPLGLNTRWRVGRLARRIRSARRLRGHYEVFATSCPGSKITAQLGAIARIAGKRR